MRPTEGGTGRANFCGAFASEELDKTCCKHGHSWLFMAPLWLPLLSQKNCFTLGFWELTKKPFQDVQVFKLFDIRRSKIWRPSMMSNLFVSKASTQLSYSGSALNLFRISEERIAIVALSTIPEASKHIQWVIEDIFLQNDSPDFKKKHRNVFPHRSDSFEAASPKWSFKPPIILPLGLHACIVLVPFHPRCRIQRDGRSWNIDPARKKTQFLWLDIDRRFFCAKLFSWHKSDHRVLVSDLTMGFQDCLVIGQTVGE